MLLKVLISCTLLVAANAAYASSSYGGSRPSALAGYAAQFQPAATLTILPSQSGGYGSGSSSYGAAPAQSYGASSGYGASRGASQVSVIPIYTNPSSSRSAGVDAEALRLASLVWGLPSAGGPDTANIRVPIYSTTSYSAPAVAVGGSRSGYVSRSSAAAAASNAGAHYAAQGPALAAVSYGAPASAGSYAAPAAANAVY